MASVLKFRIKPYQMPNEKDDRSLQTKSSCISSPFILIIYPEHLPYKTRKGENFHIMKADSWGCVDGGTNLWNSFGEAWV